MGEDNVIAIVVRDVLIIGMQALAMARGTNQLRSPTSTSI